MKRMTGAWVFLAVALAAATVCKSASAPSEPAKENPSFGSDIQSIFTASCASSLCHGAAASGGLILTSGQSYNQLVNVVSTGEPPKIRVIPGDAANSYLVIKIEGRQSVGGKMPSGGSLNSVQIQNIKNWIGKGAANN